jgi:hypothetical protein
MVGTGALYILEVFPKFRLNTLERYFSTLGPLSAFTPLVHHEGE